MKLTDFKDEEALDLLADILEPTARIFTDEDLKISIKNKASKIEIVKLAIKNHKSDVIEILARVDGKDPKNYSCNIITITKSLLDLLNDEELVDFFTLQGAMMEEESSTSVMANTKAKRQ